ncbi:protein of unknown function [Paraburkholderia dioscoreae]|uniref:Uncharacterized protein n=1 Tax=Paraburkholderia dioscoreae TaxID=2604047 RepID=A0A5Q4ZDK5_9BURK|nr:protein of unknown function [Paraburkholderia dioscoreae]
MDSYSNATWHVMYRLVRSRRPCCARSSAGVSDTGHRAPARVTRRDDLVSPRLTDLAHELLMIGVADVLV